jgi:TonB family protein
MNKNLINLISVFIFVCLLQSNAFTQESGKWTKITSPKGEFSALLPADFLVDNEDDEYRAYAFRDEVTMTVEIENSGRAKFKIKEYRRWQAQTEAKISGFTLGDFIGDVHITEKDKSFSMSIYAGSSKAFYSIWVSTKNTKSAALETFLNSITLGNQTLLKQKTATNQNNEAAVSLASLKTSPSVLEALRRPDGQKTKVTYEPVEKEEDETEDTTKYSRPLFVIRRPQARYTDNGRQTNVQGTVKLKVVFRADGQIGDITVLKKLGGGLTDQAIETARKIKFLPAEIDGKTVDVTRDVAYTFTIY